MTTGYNLWDYSVWSFIISMTVLFGVTLLANALIRIIKPLRRMLIPAPVLGGFLLLIVLLIWKKTTGNSLVDSKLMELMTFHGLGLGCAALALKTEKKEKSKKAQREIFNASLITTSSYLLQAVIGLTISIILYFLIKATFFSGMLVPMGYGQGPGQAYNWGHTYEASWGFENGTSFGLTVSAMGFISCSVGGVIYLNIMRRKNNPKVMPYIREEEDKALDFQDISGKNEIPLSDSMDKLTVQFALTFVTYAIAYGITALLSRLCDISNVKLLTGTVKPLFWGFNFIFATLGGLIVRKMIGGLKKANIIHRDYINNMMMDRVSGLMFDLMIVASIGAIELSAFRHKEFVLPLLAMCIAAAFGTYFYVDHTCRKLFPNYAEESFLALYGMLTGVVGTGVILLREIDPRFETAACKNLLFQTLWTCLMGFPLLLLMGFACRSLTWSFITFGIFLVMLVAFYLIIRMQAKRVAKDPG